MSRAWLYVIGQFVLFGVLAAALVVFPLTDGTLVRIVGLVLITVGFGVLALAILEHLRRNAGLPNVTPTPNSQVELVETGLYKHMRHPIYSGVLMGAMGVALAHGHLAVLLIALAMVVFFTYKARYEESLLRVTYPQYRAYMQRTGRFLPFW